MCFIFFNVKPALLLSLAINLVSFNRCQYGKQWFQGCFDDRQEIELEPFSWEEFKMCRPGLFTLPAAAPNKVGFCK